LKAAVEHDGISGAFKSVINTIIGWWNDLVSHLHIGAVHVGPVHFGGVNLGAGLEIPMLANGGVATRATLAVVGEAGPEAIVPLSKGHRYGLGGAGGGRMELVLDRHRFVRSGDFDVRYRGF
jgi:hypothetical protein